MNSASHYAVYIPQLLMKKSLSARNAAG